ncbi:MAG TPA: alpha/beta hydrolase [Stellaceae bacterium]|jgi:carboxypeptidase C (cathepsin A)
MAKIAASVVLCLFVLAAGARADDNTKITLPARVATHHSIELGGHRLDYDAIAETFTLTDQKGTAAASIFTVSYLVPAPAGAMRPVSFVLNGGPGAASVFLHLGALGPKIMQTPADGEAPSPPVRIIDNPSTWLPFTDLVLIDPVGTGYSRGDGKEPNPDKQFWDVHADLNSLDAVVRRWLTRHQRWTSPIYLVGESYGGFRAAAMAESLPHDVDATVSGLVLISPALDLSALHPNQRDLLASGFFLPTYAAIAGALHIVPQGAGELAAAEHFALSDYLVGLAGIAGQPPLGDPFVAEVAGMTGLRPALVRRWRARIPNYVFAHQILRDRGERVSLYDGTIARPAPAGEREESDPLLGPIAAAFGAAFNAYAADDLGYRTDQPYRVLAGNVSQQWNWEGERGEGRTGLPMTSLEAALIAHPGTKVLIANGRYDLVTPYLSSRWLIDQLPVPPATRAQIRLRVYDGGHMMYLRPASRAALAQDAAQLYAAPGPGAPSQ